MRSLFPMPGNPWPHDMSITVEDEPSLLLELLWVRDAYGLDPDGDFPDALTDRPETKACPDRNEWERVWPGLWADALAHTAEIQRPELYQALLHTTDGSLERAELLQKLVGRGWRDRFGDAALDADYGDWSRRRFEMHTGAAQLAQLQADRERHALDDLVPAWRAGLTKIVTIPCEGDFTRAIGPHALLLTERTRSDAESYATALRSFA